MFRWWKKNHCRKFQLIFYVDGKSHYFRFEFSGKKNKHTYSIFLRSHIYRWWSRWINEKKTIFSPSNKQQLLTLGLKNQNNKIDTNIFDENH